MMGDSAKSNISELSKHITLVTVVGSIVVFFSSFIYSLYFFKNISMSYSALSLPILFFSIPIVCSLFFAGFFYVYILNEAKLKTSVYSRSTYLLFISIYFLYFNILNMLQLYDSLEFIEMQQLLLPGLLIILLFFVIVRFLYKQKLFFIKYYSNIKIIFLVVMITTYIVMLAIFGDSLSEGVIEGRQGNFEVILSLKESDSVLEDKILILVMQYGGNYYLVEKCDPAPEDHPAYVYIVPDGAIKSVTVRKITSPQLYNNSGHLRMTC